MASLTNSTCPAENTINTDQNSFWDGRWDSHEIGWVIAGVTALVATVISLFSVWKHARNYYNPKQQRQVIRILFMPAVYGIVSFFSYRYFRSYTYYSVSVVAYESLVLAAFLILLLQYVGESTDDQKVILKDKEKSKIPIPFCCIRYRPSKPYFLHALKWSVLQYSLLRPAISIAEIICEAYDVLCPTAYSVYYAEVYLDSVDFVSISVALYGLIVLYDLVKEQLAGRKPLAKFLCIKLVVMLTFYQSFIFSILESHDVIKATEFWTATNVADGLNALCICCEMVIMSIAFAWAFNWKEYIDQAPPGAAHTSAFWAILDSFNYWDFIVEGGRGIRFLIDYIRGKPGTHSGSAKKKKRRKGATSASADEKLEDRRNTEYGLDMDAAFAGVENRGHSDDSAGSSDPLSPPLAQREDPLHASATAQYRGNGYPESTIPASAFGRPSLDDDPYAAARPHPHIEYRSPQPQQPVFGGVLGYGEDFHAGSVGGGGGGSGTGSVEGYRDEQAYEMYEQRRDGYGQAR
ncbi:hypothetical protein JCM11641_000479 [Rhodosporidiobolus odoratus]